MTDFLSILYCNVCDQSNKLFSFSELSSYWIIIFFCSFGMMQSLVYFKLGVAFNFSFSWLWIITWHYWFTSRLPLSSSTKERLLTRTRLEIDRKCLLNFLWNVEETQTLLVTLASLLYPLIDFIWCRRYSFSGGPDRFYLALLNVVFIRRILLHLPSGSSLSDEHNMAVKSFYWSKVRV